MAYYDDKYIWAQDQHTTYSPIVYQDPVSFSSYEPYGIDNNYDAYNVSMFQETKSIDHDDYCYNYDDDYYYDNNIYDYDKCHNWYSSNHSINYFAHNYVEPKLIAYEPVVCDTGYVSYHTQYSISYSQVDSGFNEPEFEEYDPTPYGGGYDIISEYGKPIPPSDQTCYPRSKPKPIAPRPTPMPNSESRPEPVSVVVPVPMSIATTTPPIEPKLEPKSKPKSEPMPTPIPLVEPEPKPKPEVDSEPKPVLALVPVPDPFDLKEVGGREMEKYTYPDYRYDYPWPEYDQSNVTGLGYDYGYGKQVVQIQPYEYSPEVVDLCENIFGSWPCLARIRRQQMVIDDNDQRKSCPEIGQLDPLEECASYIFGRPMASYNV